MIGTASLSLEQAPPISVPFRFFITAPVFGILAGLLILWFGPEALTLRWNPSTLALTHCLTLGFLTMAMCGALMQMLPVLAGSPVPKVRLVAFASHGLLTLGTLLLVGGFLSNVSTLYLLASISLGLGFGIFLLGTGIALFRVKIVTHTVSAMRLALVALIVTVALGITLTLGISGILAVSQLIPLTNIHLYWGMGGWLALLIFGVAYQVVPMFQMTPEFPENIKKYLAPVLLVMLAAWTVTYYTQFSVLTTALIEGLFLGLVGFFAILTLSLQKKRRRKIPDNTLSYWIFGMGMFLALALLWLAAQVYEPIAFWKGYPLLFGVIALLGAGISLINGMLLKIFSFLSWFHLQFQQIQLMRIDVTIPNMKAFVKDKEARLQAWVHFSSVGLLILACVNPTLFARPAGLVLIIAQVLLMRLLIMASMRYHAVLKQFNQPPTDMGPIPGLNT